MKKPSEEIKRKKYLRKIKKKHKTSKFIFQKTNKTE